MKRRVLVRAKAERDLRLASEWYDQQRTGLGNDFALAAATAFALLETDHEIYLDYYNGFRRVMLQRFPWKVFFRIHRDAVIVFRVLHAARDHTQQLP